VAVRHFLTPPVDETGRVSAKAAKCSIVRKLPDGSCIGFERAADAVGHPTAQVTIGTVA
jgi:hypothetical protein